VVRTFLSWSLVVELEGRWPWQSAPVAAQPEPGGNDLQKSVPGTAELRDPSLAAVVGR
jgi:hypothetical protein